MGLFSKKQKVASASTSTVSDRRLSLQSYTTQKETIRAMATITGSLDEFVDVVGESNYQPQLEKVGGRALEDGRERRLVLAVLAPEPTNQYDAGAIKVTIDGGLVGYIGKGDQELVRPLVEKAEAVSGVATCLANINGGWDRGDGDTGFIGVELDIRTSEAIANSRR
jgi:hypothetical protein